MAVTTVRSKKLSLTLVIGLVVLVLAGLAGTGYMFMQNKKLKNDIKTSEAKAPEKQNEELVKKVSNVMIVPTDEQPTIFTVDDKNKLKDQSFFKLAENGDKVLIYTKAKRAIIYRESANKIVDIGPVSVGANNQTTPSATTTQAPAATTENATPQQ